MKIFLFFQLLILSFIGYSQNSANVCSTDKVYRQFDFWLGDWEAFALNGNKAGDSKISVILDSCIILEEWTSLNKAGSFGYKGKSFNTYNALTKQWQQMWVDNAGGSTSYEFGTYANNKLTFLTNPFSLSNDTMGINRLTFFNLENGEKVRQLGELSKDNGKSWLTQYDLEYRRKKK